jgi:mannitol/fructose-specific phosphotransferase system IIA component (Ntr-type)
MAFALLVPKDATDEHLKILGLLAERLSDNDVRQQLDIAGSAQQLFDSFLVDSALSKAAG